jgi:hypothetical protein
MWKIDFFTLEQKPGMKVFGIRLMRITFTPKAERLCRQEKGKYSRQFKTFKSSM